MIPPLERIAYFVSPHGFGHAARAAAVISVLQEQRPSLHVDLFSHTPRWFFGSLLEGPTEYHELLTDIGLVQTSPLVEDLPATVRRLDEFLPFDENRIWQLARQLLGKGCQLVVCDIAPLGISVATRAGIPSVLIENFTWDWIYQGYPEYQTQLEKHIRYLETIYAKATYRIQVEPNCQRQPADLLTGPVSRKPGVSREQIRRRLEIPDQKKLILMTMGGIPHTCPFPDMLRAFEDCFFLVPGNNTRMEIHGNLILLPYHSDFYHPDLVHAADAVIGKVGYSTLAEVYHAGIPFGYITRSGFRESGILSAFVQEKMHGLPITEAEYQDGSWTGRLRDLLELPTMPGTEKNGADHVADFLVNRLESREGRLA
ncbi:MAG: glycosyltransferase family protein [bacterium]